MLKQLTGAETELEKEVQQISNEQADGYEDGVDGFMRDLCANGCISGMISGLISYRDTCAFYERNKIDINALLAGMIDSTDEEPAELFGDK